jgi:hypothetical protein
MPSPVGHSLMGYVIYGATGLTGDRNWTVSMLYLFAANAPDLDFLPGLVIGNLSKYHHGPSHSVGFAILFGIVASLFFSRRLYTLSHPRPQSAPRCTASVAIDLRILHGAVRLFSQVRLPRQFDRFNVGGDFHSA